MLHVDTTTQVDELGAVPTDRRVALRLLWLLDDPRASPDAITHVISADPALTVRVLALANAAGRGTGEDVMSLPRAVTVLGPRAVHAVACTAVLNLFSTGPDLPEPFWLHAITAGVAAARLAFDLHRDPSEALTAGLLHDFGEQLLRERDPQWFDDMLAAVAGEPAEIRLNLERERFGIDHARLGAKALSSHGLPAQLTDAIMQHHDVGAAGAPLTKTVRIADCVAKIVEGDDQLDLTATLHAEGIETDGARLLEHTEVDRRALILFLAADFQAPRFPAR
jgi:putative nucleotidyltransferase with HDIG domain